MTEHGTLTLGQVMTPNPHTIDISNTLSNAKSRMEALQVSHMPVMDGDLVESIVSDRDIKRFTLPGHELRKDEELLVSDICPMRAYLADINDPLYIVLNVMYEKHIGAVIALKDGDLAGIFTETDACRLLMETLKE
jgi:CBS domain-containing protein